MTRRDVNEGDVFRKGFATTALEKGATEGQVPALGADGEAGFVDAGGGSLPEWWTIGDGLTAEIGGRFTFSADGNQAAIDLLNGDGLPLLYVLGDATFDGRLFGVRQYSDSDYRLLVLSESVSIVAATTVQPCDDNEVALLVIPWTVGQTAPLFGTDYFGAGPTSGFDAKGYPFILGKNGPNNLLNSAPADGSFAPSELKLWFDDTNGAAKLMIKAKQADGTVKTAAVALS